MLATIFDFNGVLVDDEHVHLEAFRAVLKPLGVTVTDDDYATKYLGFDDVGALRAMLRDAGLPAGDDAVRALVDAKKPVYFAHIATALRIFPGAEALVRRRAALGTVGVVSGALDGEIRYCLGRMGVLDLVSFIVPAEQTTACKPDPQGYVMGLEALAKLGGPHTHVVVLEDSIAGVQAAKSAGLRCVGVAHSYTEAELLAAGADAVAADLLSLTDALLDGPAA